MCMSIFSSTIYLRNYPFVHCVLDTLIEYHLTVYIWGLFKSIYSISWVYIYVFMVVLYCFYYCNFVMQIGTRRVIPPGLFFLLKIALLFFFFFFVITYEIFEWFFYLSKKIPLRLWYGWNWICRFLWVVWTFKK